jgi:hypothetical protein
MFFYINNLNIPPYFNTKKGLGGVTPLEAFIGSRVAHIT